MKHSLRTGITFGLTSAVITTLGLMIGLHAGTHSRVVVLGGILTIAIADAFSDALGIHVAEEARSDTSARDVWEATIATFAAKFLFALTFAVPILLLPLGSAVWISFGWGMLALAVLSWLIARTQGEAPWRVVGEHLLIALVVIAVTHQVGRWVATLG